MAIDTELLAEQCKAVLYKNDQGDFTVPAEGLYPHQWLWDSCFIAIGLRHHDIERAKKEILSLLRGQWANGMLPHMIFAEGDEHKRDHNIWRSWLSPYSPDEVKTSGITQPPVLAEAIVRIGEKLKLPERRSWYQTVFPALLAYHQWLYADRDPHQEGLVLQIHPYETGLDNSPPWINQIYSHNKPWWLRLLELTKLEVLVNLVRRDLRRVPPGQRVSNIVAMHYYSNIRRLRRKLYFTEKILDHSLFTVEDLTFNCILIRANTHLKSIAKTIAREVPQELLASMAKTEEALEQLWDGYSGEYFSRNFASHKLIKESSISTLMPFYAGTISKERAAQLVKLMQHPRLFWPKFPVPTVPISSKWFREHGYWQGPVWLNTNWLIIDGLKRYGYDKLANQIKQASLQLVFDHGPNEYFSPLDGSPAGAQGFSWTAALSLDLVSDKHTSKASRQRQNN